MKKIGFLIFGLIFLVGCAEEKNNRNNLFNPFQTNKKVKSQFFNLDTIGLKEITGKKGTKIYFIRDFFEVDSTDKISMELKEFYNISDLIRNNIRTITKDNKLLESSGVIYLNFTKNGERLKLKDSANLRVRFPVEFSKQDKIFKGEKDLIDQIFWSETEAYFMVLRYDQIYGIELGYDVTIDSLAYYQELWRKEDSIYERTIGIHETIEKKVGTSISISNLGWINIDKFIEDPIKTNFTFSNNLQVDGIIIYAIYNDLNSFTSYYPDETENIILKEIPVVEETFLIAVGIKDGQLFAQKIPVGKNDILELSLKAINQTGLDKLFEEK